LTQHSNPQDSDTAEKLSCTARLIVINQTTSSFFDEWLHQFAKSHGPVELWTGTPPSNSSNGMIVRRLPAYDRSSTRTRLVSWLRFTLIVSWLLLTTARRTPVYAVTNPPFMPLILVLHHRLFGRAYALLEYDIYPQIMKAMGIIGEKSLVYRFWWRWHAWALSEAAVVITISEMMADELRSMVPQRSFPLKIITTWTPTDRLRPIPESENDFIDEHQLRGKFVVIYSGNLGSTHAIEAIVDVAERLRDHSSILFLIVGDGLKRPLIEEAIASGKTPNIRLLPFQPVDRLAYSLSSAEVAIVTLGKGYEHLSMPSKTYDMMATGNAILGISYPPSNLELTLKRHHCGTNLAPDQIDEIASWILHLADDRNKLKKLQIASRQAAVDHFSATACQPKLTKTIEESLLKP
jgi:glycosyltransferase involved in cell wall biosynthesis